MKKLEPRGSLVDLPRTNETRLGFDQGMKRVGLYVVLAFLVGILLFFDYAMGRLSFAEPRLNDLNNLQQKEVDIFLQKTSLLAGFATLALGGIGALIWESRKRGQTPPQLIVAAAGSALSLYFGYLSYQYLLWMLDHQFFSLTNPVVTVTSLSEFLTFLVSIIALADFVVVTQRSRE